MQRILLGTTTAIVLDMAQSAWLTPATAQDTRNAELAHYDAALNKTYSAIVTQLDEERRNNLRQAQRAWIQMRDFDCGWAFVDTRDCQIDRTVNREKELRESYFMAKDGEYRSVGVSVQLAALPAACGS